jgi:DNA ligase 1
MLLPEVALPRGYAALEGDRPYDGARAPLVPAPPVRRPPPSMTVPRALGAAEMRVWAETAELIRATTRTSQKVAVVAEYLRGLDAGDLPLAAVYLSGRPFPERDQRSTGLGWAAISAAAQQVAGAAEGALAAAYDRSSDLGTSVAELLAAVGHEPPADRPSLTLADVAEAWTALAAASGRDARRAILTDLLARCDPLSARYVTAILTGELRIGLREGHLQAGIATAFGRPIADVQWAGMLTGDVGRTAELARDDGLGSARLSLFHPLKSMLASAVADEAEALARLSPPVWVEDKYDGIRAQLHKQGDGVVIYSRDLREVTGQFPEVAAAAAASAWDGILDGEILAWRDGAALPFLLLQARLGRKRPSAAIQEQVPVIFVAFDLLAAGDPVEPLLRLPLRERRRRLESLGLERTSGFGLAELVTAADGDELRALFAAAQARGNEGLVVKDPKSGYAPGRRGHAWLKLKRALTTLDCVVVGVEVGHGRRHGVLSDYTFAVIDDRPGAGKGRLVTIGKAYSGLSDAEIGTMTRWFEAHTISRHGRYRVVEPSIVVEIAFDIVQRSARHASGFALRFPRIVRIREDKPPAEADRLSSVAALHERLAVAGRYGVLAVDGRREP